MFDYIPRPEWTYRDHEQYDSNQIGAISQARVITALVEAGKDVFLPFVEVLRYDLVFEENGQFYRVQCKTGHISRGAVYFPTQSFRAAKRGTNWVRVGATYEGEIDYFGVYCPDNNKVYLVPIKDVDTKRMGSLRIDPPKNNQKRGIRWASHYEVVPLRSHVVD